MPNPVVKTLTVDGVTYNLKDVDSDSFAPKASPALTGTPTAPTPSSGASDTQIATVKYVQDSMAGAGAGTVTSVGVANATNGGLSVSGSPVTGSGTISVGHSNVLASAQTTSGIYPIKIDKNGHISEYGNAVSIPTKTSDLTNDSGYITSQYIESKTDYSILVSRVGEIEVGETVIGTDSTNFPTSKAVVDYVDERVVQEIEAIDVGVVSVNGKTGNVTLNASDVGALSSNVFIPTSTSQLTNDSGFITSYVDEKVKQEVVSSGLNKHLSILLAPSVNGTYTTTTYKDVNFTYNPATHLLSVQNIQINNNSGQSGNKRTTFIGASTTDVTITFPEASGTLALTSDIPTVPTTVSSFTNDAGYLTASDIASVMSYKGTKANYAALPSTGNTTGDVWHLTDTGAEWAWDGSAWQELGTAIDLSGYLQTSDIASWAKQSTKPSYALSELTGASDVQAIEALSGTSGLLKKTAADTWTLDTSTYLTSYTETDPVFTASAAYGISSSDISNWNSKAAGDHQHGNIGNTGHITTYDSITSGSRLIFAKNGNWEVLMTPESMAFGTDSTKYLANNGTWQNIPTNTDTTYTLSNALSSHKFTSTLTAGGSGSGTSTATMEFVAGTGITLTDDTTNKKITIASSVVNTDEKVKQVPLNGANSGHSLLFGFTQGDETTDISYVSNKISWNDYSGALIIGQYTNSTNSIRINSEQIHFKQGYYSGIILQAPASLSSNYIISFPDKSGTVALTDDTFQSTSTTLTTAGWSSKTQTVNVTGITSSNTVVVSPAPTSHVEYCSAGVYCSAQGSGTLTFTCDEVPESALTVNILYK